MFYKHLLEQAFSLLIFYPLFLLVRSWSAFSCKLHCLLLLLLLSKSIQVNLGQVGLFCSRFLERDCLSHHIIPACLDLLSDNRQRIRPDREADVGLLVLVGSGGW